MNDDLRALYEAHRPALLMAINEYAAAVHDASAHQSASKADIASSQALAALSKIRRLIQSLIESAAVSTPEQDAPTIDLDAIAWGEIKQAASASRWMPVEYVMNDWVSDVCRWLRDRPPTPEPQKSEPPQVGEFWPGQGGIYAGLTRHPATGITSHLILGSEKPERDLAWHAAMAWAADLKTEGHADWRVPSRFESALLYANLQHELDTSGWHWTSTQYSVRTAWIQDFYDGGQGNGKRFEARVRAVRTVPVEAAQQQKAGEA